MLKASIYNWREENFKTIFGSKLRGDPEDWHVHRMREFPLEHFKDWCKAFKEKFRAKMDEESMKRRFDDMAQRPNQQNQHYIDKLGRVYDSIYKASRYTTGAGVKTHFLKSLWKVFCLKLKLSWWILIWWKVIPGH